MDVQPFSASSAHTAGALAASLIHGTGEMAELVRSRNWASTVLGPVESWSEAFLTTLNIVLSSPLPSAIYWGPEWVLLYNDGFRSFAGHRHPASLGAPAAQVWKEAWHVLEPQLKAVFTSGDAIYHENFLLPFEVGGEMQDFYWTYSYSPVYEDGRIAGVFNVCQNTTGRFIGERKLRESEARAQRVLASIGDAVIVTDAGGCVTHMNSLAEQFTGWTGDDAKGHHLREIFHIIDESTRELVEDPADKVKRMGTIVGLADNTILVPRQGKEIHIDDSGAPIRDDAGKLIGTVLVFRNVEEKRQIERDRAEAAARDHERAVAQDLQLKLLQDHRDTVNPAAMLLAAAEMVGQYLKADRVGFFDIADETTLRFTVGWTAGALPLLTGDLPSSGIGSRYLLEVLAGKTLGISDYAKDPLTQDAVFAQIGTRAGIGVPVLRHGQWQTGLYVHSATVREWSEAEVTFVREVANQTFESVELALALQAVRRSEARARKILESIGDAVIVTDAQSLITGMNPVAEEFTGWTLEEVCAQPLDKVLRLVGQNSAEGAVDPSVEADAESAMHLLLIGRDGRERHIDRNASPIREDDGRLSGEVLIFRDTSDRETAERRLRQAYKMEALGQLTGGIAHDFNNILAIIMGNLELIAEATDTNSVAQERIGQAVASAERAADLTRRLLAYARQQPLDPVAVNVEHLVHAAAEFIRRSLGPTVVLTVTIDEGLWSAKIDRNQFENALLNLAVNARDAMPGGGQLKIHAANSEIREAGPDTGGEIDPGEYLLISVTDNGVGMSRESLLRAAEPFFTTKAIGKGTGLGLSMVYGFLKQSGGRMNIESELGAGTCVKLYLPRTVASERPPAATDARKHPLPSALPRGTELILVVEDELAIRRTISYLLNSLGYRVLEAEDGPGALLHLRETQSIDLLLTDVILPNGISGPAIANEAKALQPGMKAIFSSGYTANVLTRDYSLHEGVHLLNKPFHLAELAKMVRDVLDLPKT